MTDLLASIRHEAIALADAAERDLLAPIARYPGWTELDLLVHTGSVHRRTTETIRTAASERIGRLFPPDEEPATVQPWFREGAEELATVLEAADPDMQVWGFGPEPGVRGWTVRMALETVIHRWDAERAVQEASPVDADLAVMGIEEFAALWSGAIELDGDAAPLCLQATDTGDAWILASADKGVSFSRGEADERVSGTADALYRWLLGRADLAELQADPDVGIWHMAFRGLPDARR